MPRCSGAFRLMQRPRLVQKLTAAAELRGWRREEGEEERHEGEKRNDPSVLFIRQRDMCQARQSRGHKNEAVASISADLLNKEA